MTRASPLFRRGCGGGAVIAALIAADPARADELPRETSQATRAPTYSLWTGLRFGIFIPYGALYTDHSFITTPFEDVASSGPALELDVGARFGQRFVAYGLLEQTFLGPGRSTAWTTPHGGQSGSSMAALGAGLRWESNPDGLGIVADAALAYRWLTAHWSDGTTLRMQGPAEVHAGLGASLRIVPQFTIAPMMSVFSGVFSHRSLDGQTLGASANSYSAVAFTLSGHVDVD